MKKYGVCDFMREKKIRHIDKLKEIYRESKKSSILIYLILRGLVIFCMVMQIMHGDIGNAFLCLISLALLIMPTIIQDKFNITLPNTLEIIIYLFIFAAEILGEINNFYKVIPHWDTALHTINGFLCAAIGFSLVNLLNETSNKINLSPVYLCIVAFCFSMTIGVLWEFFEYGCDQILLVDMQKDSIITRISTVTLDPDQKNNSIIIKDIGKTVLYDASGKELTTINGGYLDIGMNDTMKDLFVNFIGAVVFGILGYIYLKTNKNDKFISKFVPTKRKESVSNAEMKKDVV